MGKNFSMTMTAFVDQPVSDRPPELSLDDVRRDAIVDSRGVKYKEFKRGLAPKYGLVWTHLLSGHVVLIATTIAAIFLYRGAPGAVPFIILGASLIYGYALAYILLFFHEASHYNLARDREMNDRLANIFIGLLVGQDIKGYRPIHFDHHRYLGMPEDTEHTYFDPLNIRFIVESLTGVKPMKVLTRREKIAANKGNTQVRATLNAQLLAGAAVNGIFLLGMILLGYWPIAVAWVIGMLIVFPFFASVRQLLEHRSEDARADVDYTREPHGEVNRMFGSGPLASTLGGAGFNRHLLHHWEPQISYTRLRDLERFLLDTEAAPIIERHRTSYTLTFLRLFNH